MSDVGQRLRRAAEELPVPEGGIEGLHRRRDRKRRNERIAAGVVAGVIALAALGGSLLALRSVGGGGGAFGPAGGSPGGTEEDAEETRGLAIEAGRYFYLRTVLTGTMGWTAEEDGEPVPEDGEVVIETWWAPDGSGRIRVPRSEGAYGVPEEGRFGPDEFPIESDVSGLSTDPEVLALQLRDRSAPGGASPQPAITPGPGQSEETGPMWRAVRRLLEYPNTPPLLRAAIFQVAANVRGVEVRRDAEDPAGREAVLLQITSEQIRQRLYFDPVTLQLMASEDVFPEGGEPQVAILDAGIVDGIDRTPEDDEVLFPRSGA